MYRYLEKLKEYEYTVDAIIYLVPDASKNPDFSTYSKEEKEAVEKLLVKIIGYDGSENDLYSNFIEKEYKQLDTITKSNLKQYGDLLKDKGVANMNEPIIEKFYEELMKDKEKYEHALFVQDMMNNLLDAKYLYFKKRVCNLIFFNKFNDGNEKNHLVMGVTNKNGVHSIEIYFNEDDNYNQKMYICYEHKTEKKVFDLLDKFEDKNFTYKIKKDEANRDDKNWCWVEIAYFKPPYDDFYIEKFIKKLDNYFFENFK